MQVVDNQASENIRGDNDSPTDELLLDNGLEEEEEEEEEEEGEGEQLPVHHHEDVLEQEITEGPEPVGDVGEDTTENDFPGATGMIWEWSFKVCFSLTVHLPYPAKYFTQIIINN